MKKRIHIPTWLVYGVPIVLLVHTYCEHIYSLSSGVRIYREYGLVENATAFMLFVAIILSLLCLKKAISLWEKVWLLIIAVGSFYFLGEEISWGYHFFHYDIGDQWIGLNDQKEPNLHNLTGTWEIIFDKLPRQLLSVGVIIGGLMGVFADRLDSLRKNRLLRRLTPSGDTLFVGVLANVVSVPEKILTYILAYPPKWLVLGNASGELKECLLALFIMLYPYGILRSAISRKKTSVDQ